MMFPSAAPWGPPGPRLRRAWLRCVWLRRVLFIVLVALVVPRAPALWAQALPDRPQIVAYRPVVAKALPRPDEICTLHPGPPNAKTRVLPAVSSRGKAAKTANIVVEYNGFSAPAREAFQRAVDIWETHIQSDVTIKVAAQFANLGENVLGGAGPPQRGGYWFGTREDGVTSIYPSALFDALIGENAVENDDDPSNDDAPDIIAVFSSDANWYFDEAPPQGPGPTANQVDFTSVVLHEIGHGLGFFGTLQVDEATGLGEWRFGETPVIYDRFTETGNGASLVNTNRFPNPSETLADVLTSGNVFFSGLEADVGAAAEPGPVPPKLYAPSRWDPGSSYSHVDEITYLAGDPNSLMTPRIGGNEIIHQPGSITCGMFADMGWQLGPDCAALFDVEVVGFVAEDTGNRTIEISWTETRVADVAQYEVQSSYFGSAFSADTVFSSEGAQQYTLSLRDLTVGKQYEVGEYAFRLVFIRPNGDRVPVGESEITVRLRQPFELAEIYPNPFSAQANIKLAVRRAQTFRVEVYDALGRRVAVLYDRRRQANDPRPITFDAARLEALPSGRYFFRVIGEEFEQTRSAVFVR